MARYVLVLGFLSFVLAGFTQDTADTTEVKKPPPKFRLFLDRQDEFGLFLNINYGLHPTPKNPSYNGLIETGIRWDRWQFGLFYAGYDGSYSELLIFPTEFSLAYENAGAYMGFRLGSMGVLDIFGMISYSYGFIEWIPEAGFDGEFARDHFTILQPAILVETNIIRWLRLNARIGYKSVGDFDLPRLDPGDLNGLYGMIGLKVGMYKRRLR